MKDTVKIPNKNEVKIVAHRGYSLIERENTVNAFVAACQRSVWGVECDIHATSDGKYLVYHDDTTERLCDKKLVMEKSSFAELRALKIKETDSEEFSEILKMPTLQEYLAIVKRYGKMAIVELKNRMEYEQIAEVIDICEKEYDLNKVVFISFSFDNLTDVRKILPTQSVMFLCNIVNDTIIDKLVEYNFGVDCNQGYLTEDTVKILKEKGIAINAWICNPLERAQTLISWGVEYITSDILE